MTEDTARNRYRTIVVPYTPGRSSCALSLLALWERPWSPNALRFAYHALHLAMSRGLDVLGVVPEEMRETLLPRA